VVVAAAAVLLASALPSVFACAFPPLAPVVELGRAAAAFVSFFSSFTGAFAAFPPFVPADEADGAGVAAAAFVSFFSNLAGLLTVFVSLAAAVALLAALGDDTVLEVSLLLSVEAASDFEAKEWSSALTRGFICGAPAACFLLRSLLAGAAVAPELAALPSPLAVLVGLVRVTTGVGVAAAIVVDFSPTEFCPPDFSSPRNSASWAAAAATAAALSASNACSAAARSCVHECVPKTVARKGGRWCVHRFICSKKKKKNL
jgi:hypothetical protein